MQVSQLEWSLQEQAIAQKAFDQSYTREISALIQEVRIRANAMTKIEETWRLHDFLSARRHEIDGKYDYSFPTLVFTFAKLVKDGWLTLEELQGLEGEKLAKIAALARF